MKMRRISRALVTALVLLATVPFAAGAQTTVESPAARNIGLLWWPADPSKTMYSFSRQIDTCLTRQFTRSLPDFSIIRHEVVQNMLYPLMEPGTQPASELDFADMLRRGDVRARLARNGLRYLVAFSGSTYSGEAHGGIFCGGGYGGAGCLGFAWATKETVLEAVLWDLKKDSWKHAAGSDIGTSVVPAFILPIPLIASTQSDACKELGSQVISAIKGDAVEEE